MTKSELLNELYKKYGLDKEDTFRSPQGWTIITRAGIDKIQAQADIDITFDLVYCYHLIIIFIYRSNLLIAHALNMPRFIVDIFIP